MEVRVGLGGGRRRREEHRGGLGGERRRSEEVEGGQRRREEMGGGLTPQSETNLPARVSGDGGLVVTHGTQSVIDEP